MQNPTQERMRTPVTVMWAKATDSRKYPAKVSNKLNYGFPWYQDPDRVAVVEIQGQLPASGTRLWLLGYFIADKYQFRDSGDLHLYQSKQKALELARKYLDAVVQDVTAQGIETLDETNWDERQGYVFETFLMLAFEQAYEERRGSARKAADLVLQMLRDDTRDNEGNLVLPGTSRTDFGEFPFLWQEAIMP